ncbi:metallophosphoesterase [Mycobacterium sp. Marseille-P9652]|uniref:metallophosphoesterase n=1 Tax=Mycobacterium sp. Marseille-P9652 TaxID=2654950 RepID=UPI0012E71645|nr:metallophosphoesterase [Mycobacterium sp. Marseille-P9652]
MEGLDIIGDVHGCASPLRQLLERLGYTVDPGSGAYRHPQRRALFVGDLIDRGAEQREVLQLVEAMVDCGSADVVMGNHEFNAIAYAIPDPDHPGEFMRRHTEKNNKQHRAFLTQLDPAEQAYYLEWFLTLPLWLDLGHVRAVHACWHTDSMRVVEAACGGNRLTGEHLVDAARKGTDLYRAVEVLLKGPELSLTRYGQPPYLDKEAHRRQEARVRWWDPDAATLRDLADVRGAVTEAGEPYPELPALEIDPGEGRTYVYTDPVPLFYGHYWRSWENHREDWTTYTACVDFSAAAKGPLVAYRWNGEPTISWEHYFPHDPQHVSRSASA